MVATGNNISGEASAALAAGKARCYMGLIARTKRHGCAACFHFFRRSRHCARAMAMILEIAEIDVKPGEEAQFEAGVEAARAAFARAWGFRSLALRRSIENPARYRLFIEWEALEDHIVHFRNSENFTEWRRLAGPHFAAPPRVEHYEPV
jgi:heme-degrading monooxygenase HmoA